MRTLALEIDDEVFEKAQAEAARQGITPEELAAKALTASLPTGRRVQSPVFSSKSTGVLNLTPEMIRQVEHEDDMRRSGLLD